MVVDAETAARAVSRHPMELARIFMKPFVSNPGPSRMGGNFGLKVPLGLNVPKVGSFAKPLLAKAYR
jgi:hypothetical protein